MLIFKNDQYEEVRHKLENSFYLFCAAAWPYIEGGREFVPGWHIRAMCDHLEACYRGEIRDLLINVPPRTGKSSVVSVLFPAWVWAKSPELQFFYASYSGVLSQRDSIKCCRLIQSIWYQTLWGHKFRLLSENKTRFDNDHSGYRMISSITGSTTGFGGDFLIADDPNSMRHVESETIRHATNVQWWDASMSNRGNNPKEVRRIIAQQRGHEMDLSGHLLAKESNKLVHLCLPMEFEESRRCITVPIQGKLWQDPRKEEGDLLWAARIGPVELDEFKRDLGGEYYVASQLQQRPAPAEGGIIKKHWFKRWTQSHMPQFEHILQSWDTALIGGNNPNSTRNKDTCYSACTTWGVFRDDSDVPCVMLLSAWRGKVEYPELRMMAKRLYDNYKDMNMKDEPLGHDERYMSDAVVVEAKANGDTLIQELHRMGIVVHRFNPTRYGDKIARGRSVSALIECGRVYVPTRANGTGLPQFADEFVECCAVFPNKDSNDYVDSMSQALIKLRSSGWITHRDDYKETEYTQWQKQQALV